MAKNLVIVESPTKAKTLERYLGSEFSVKASMGHIRDLPESKIGVDTERNFEPEYVVPDQKKKVVTALRQAHSRSSDLWLATDFDREGEIQKFKPREYWTVDARLSPNGDDRAFVARLDQVGEDRIKTPTERKKG